MAQLFSLVKYDFIYPDNMFILFPYHLTTLLWSIIYPIIYTSWGPQTIATLVQITPICLWFMVPITIVNGVYKPSYKPH